MKIDINLKPCADFLDLEGNVNIEDFRKQRVRSTQIDCEVTEEYDATPKDNDY